MQRQAHALSVVGGAHAPRAKVLRRVAVMVLALFLTSCTGPTDPGPPRSETSATVDVDPAREAVATSPDGRLVVEVPAKSVAGHGTLSVRAVTATDGVTGWDIELSGTRLTGTATLRFKVPRRTADEPLPLVRYADHEGAPLTAVRTASESDGDLVVTTDHFSFWVIDPWNAVRDDLWQWVSQRYDEIASVAASDKGPRCDDETQVRNAGFGVTSDSGSRVYWCLGRDDGTPVLKVVNARGYGVALEHTAGLDVTALDRKDFLGSAAELFTSPPSKPGNEVELLPPGSSAELAIEGSEPVGVMVTPDAGAYLLTALQFAVDTFTQVWKKVGSGTDGVRTLMAALQAEKCLSSMSGMASTQLDSASAAASFFNDALAASFDCVADVVDDIDVGWVNEVVVAPLVWLFTGLATAANGLSAATDVLFDLDGYRIVVTPPAAPPTKRTVIDPFTSTGLKPGWRLDRSAASAGPVDCTYDEGSPHAVGPATHFCGSTADAANACWSAQFSTAEIWCLNAFDPSSRVLSARAAQGLVDDTPAPAEPSPLFLELADGSRFWYRIGGAWGGRDDGLLGAYGCANNVGVCAEAPPRTDGNVVLTPPASAGTSDVVDTSGPVWRVWVGPLGDPSAHFPTPRAMPVRTAWFIAGHRWQGD